jgi:hypothetical protein
MTGHTTEVAVVNITAKPVLLTYEQRQVNHRVIQPTVVCGDLGGLGTGAQ